VDMARHSLASSRRRLTGRPGRRRRARSSPHASGSPAAPVTALSSRTLSHHSSLRARPTSTTAHPATVSELREIAGAREALVHYIGILQEWALPTDHQGTAP
jgi:hypothetical protein